MRRTRLPRLATVAVLLVCACYGDVEREAPEGPTDRASSPEIARFLERHWRRPIPPQGEPPEGWAPVVADLDPENCAVCHPAQHADWKTSFHAGAYPPGLEAQLVGSFETEPAFVAGCMSCHGPLAEQLRMLEVEDGVYVANPDFDPGLERHGVVCAACHVRAWTFHGPPRRDGSLTPAPPGTPHEGVVRAPAFEASRFCASCHQFETPAPNGKPLENTVREWEATDFARRGVTCQACHMPDRRHLWRGIHDPEMVRSGVTPVWAVGGEPTSDEFEVRIGLENTGTGHHFPTYVTPAVDLELALLDAHGDTLATRTRTLQRDVYFDGTAWIEREDDRIPAGESGSLVWRGPAPAGAARVVGRVVVRPDAFYADLFERLVRTTAPDEPARPLLEAALERTLASPFELWRWEAGLAGR